ncbi:MAG TPA: hypothetical protein VKA49_16080 [Flavitalea sp.]|nr:hypothetical protein [Flavitalea sp.]
MKIENEKTPVEYSAKMQELFYVEELEDRFEMATAAAIVPNLACWEINF